MDVKALRELHLSFLGFRGYALQKRLTDTKQQDIMLPIYRKADKIVGFLLLIHFALGILLAGYYDT
jgi:hypothetical protein